MKILVTAFIICSVDTFAQHQKTIVVTADKPVDLNKTSICFNAPDEDQGSCISGDDLKKISKRSFSFTTNADTFFIKYSGKIPYEFRNMRNCDTDTITITTLKLIDYNPADTIYTSVSKYKRDSTMASTKNHQRIIRNKNIDLLSPPAILVNKTDLQGSRQIEVVERITNACTPYKITIQETWKGRKVWFVYIWMP